MTDFIVIIKPAIPPAWRHKIENSLKSGGFDISGGGTDTDLKSCSISMSRDLSDKDFKE